MVQVAVDIVVERVNLKLTQLGLPTIINVRLSRIHSHITLPSVLNKPTSIKYALSITSDGTHRALSLIHI